MRTGNTTGPPWSNSAQINGGNYTPIPSFSPPLDLTRLLWEPTPPPSSDLVINTERTTNRLQDSVISAIYAALKGEFVILGASDPTDLTGSRPHRRQPPRLSLLGNYAPRMASAETTGPPGVKQPRSLSRCQSRTLAVRVTETSRKTPMSQPNPGCLGKATMGRGSGSDQRRRITRRGDGGRPTRQAGRPGAPETGPAETITKTRAWLCCGRPRRHRETPERAVHAKAKRGTVPGSPNPVGNPRLNATVHAEEGLVP